MTAFLQEQNILNKALLSHPSKRNNYIAHLTNYRLIIKLNPFSLEEKISFISNKKQNDKLPTDSSKVHHSRDHIGESRVQIEYIRPHRRIGGLPSKQQPTTKLQSSGTTNN